jgi:hypothetical protein
MMSGGSGASGEIGAIREHYTPLPAGTVLWHVYPSKFKPHAFSCCKKCWFWICAHRIFGILVWSAERHTEWQRLCIVPERHYDLTHAAARELVTAAPRAAGLSWHSRQMSAQTAYVFYTPPLKPPAELEVIDTIELDRPAGWSLIDKALEGVGVERMGSSAPVKGIVDELPSDEFDGG